MMLEIDNKTVSKINCLMDLFKADADAHLDLISELANNIGIDWAALFDFVMCLTHYAAPAGASNPICKVQLNKIFEVFCFERRFHIDERVNRLSEICADIELVLSFFQFEKINVEKSGAWMIDRYKLPQSVRTVTFDTKSIPIEWLAGRRLNVVSIHTRHNPKLNNISQINTRTLIVHSKKKDDEICFALENNFVEKIILDLDCLYDLTGVRTPSASLVNLEISSAENRKNNATNGSFRLDAIFPSLESLCIRAPFSRNVIKGVLSFIKNNDTVLNVSLNDSASHNYHPRNISIAGRVVEFYLGYHTFTLLKSVMQE